MKLDESKELTAMIISLLIHVGSVPWICAVIIRYGSVWCLGPAILTVLSISIFTWSALAAKIERYLK